MVLRARRPGDGLPKWPIVQYILSPYRSERTYVVRKRENKIKGKIKADWVEVNERESVNIYTIIPSSL